MTILLVDLSAIAKKHWHTSSSDPDPDATTNRTVAEVYALASGNPHVAICCDSGRSWRKDISGDYKANRPERESAYDHQYQQAIERLTADGFAVWSVKGYEADDVIATAVTLARTDPKVGSVLIATADKDLLALVDDTVSVKSIRNGDVLGPAEVFTKLGVAPGQVRDYLCLVGDTSDNIKGAPGIGPKGATELLNRYGTLEDIFAHVDDLKPGTQKGLADLAPRIDTVRQLVTLRTDAPIDLATVLTERHAPTVEEPIDMPDDIDYAMPDSSAPATPEPQTALTPVVSGELVPWEKGLEPRTMGEAQALAKWVHASRLFIGSHANPEAAYMTILAGRELGLQAMASLRAIFIVEGKPTLAADLIRGLVLSSGKAEYFRCTERTPEAAAFVTKRKDDPGAEPMTLRFTLDDAKRAGLGGWNGTKFKDGAAWLKSPADQCVARASAKLARLVFPDVVHGLYDPSELEDR